MASYVSLVVIALAIIVFARSSETVSLVVTDGAGLAQVRWSAVKTIARLLRAGLAAGPRRPD